MKLFIHRLSKSISDVSFRNIMMMLIFGILGTFLLKDPITPLLFTGRSFEGRSLFIKIGLLSSYLVVLFLLFFIIHKLYHGYVAKNTFSSVNESLGKSYKTLVVALITVSFGVLIIFIFNNLVSQIDTTNWKLKNPESIPVMEPIGNDFRVGLYDPAVHLIENGFKGIAADNSYPSLYPPIVNVFSVPYTIFYVENAFLLHVFILFCLNIFVLIIAAKIARKILLEKAIDNQVAIIFASILLFIVVAFFNFSSYGFLFSIERGNVDIIAMFFIMLSIWTLVSQPKRIWLQVIFLSIATHYKIYPAILFLLLFYYHGKKMILPTLLVNLAFLFVLGPKTAWAFIMSLTTVESGAGTGINWTWVGNHGAFSFAEYVTRVYDSLAPYLKIIFIGCLLAPIAMWMFGVINVIKNQKSNLNIILLLMITLPLMDLLPTISNDYRLIIQSTTILLFIGLIFSQLYENPSGEQIIELLFVLIIMFFIARPYDAAAPFSYNLKGGSSFFINNKYLWCLSLEALMVWNIFSHNRQKKGMKELAK